MWWEGDIIIEAEHSEETDVECGFGESYLSST